VLICDTFKQKHEEKKMSYWLTKITLLTCKSLALCSFLQSSTVRANKTVLLVVMGKFRNGVVRGQKAY